MLFGGASSTVLNDLWEWDGVAWTQLAQPTAPPSRSGHGLAYDLFRARVVLFGGTAGGDATGLASVLAALAAPKDSSRILSFGTPRATSPSCSDAMKGGGPQR